jgi:hypothetical protein
MTESRASEKIGGEENIGAGFRVPAVQSLGRKMRPLLGFSRHSATAGEKIRRKRWRREWDSDSEYGALVWTIGLSSDAKLFSRLSAVKSSSV